MALARVGVEVLNLYDSDKVELHNTASQTYGEQDVGKFKVHAVKEQIKAINPEIVVYTHSNAVAREPNWVVENDYIIVAVDSMEQRKRFARIMRGWGRDYPRNIKRVIDVRIGGEQIDVFNAGRHAYSRTIRENADVDPCGARYVGYVSAIAGALGAKEVLDVIRAEMSGNPQNQYNGGGSRWASNDTKSYAVDVRNMQIVNQI